MNAITTTTAPLNYGDLERLANSIAKSGLFGIKTPDQAMALMMIAAAEGRHPALAARDYDIVNGRPTKKAEAMLRDFIQAGGKVEWHALTDELADATFTHPQTGSVRIDWDMKRAQTAFGKKDMYSKFPRQMLRSRVVSEGVRTLWPLATSGMYIEEEIGNLPPHHTGPTLDHEAEAEAPSPAPLRAAAAPTPRGERKVADEKRLAAHAEVVAAAAATPMPERKVADEPPRPRTRKDYLDGLEIALRDAKNPEEVDRIVCGEEVMRAKETFQNGHKQRLETLISEALAKWWHTPPDDDGEVDDLHIVGEEKVAAGD
jgi:hypothetical protein